MKKRLLSVIPAILLLFALCCAAYGAQSETYSTLGTIYAGSDVDWLLIETGYGYAECTGGTLPAGLRLSSDEYDGRVRHSLKGFAMYAGNYSFDVTIKSEYEDIIVIHCSATVAAAYPNVQRCGDVTIQPGFSAQINVSAYSSDGGSLSYQWYGDGAALPGEVGSSLIVAPETPGSHYYYCAVTNNNNGSYTTSNSEYITVNVTAPRVNSISVRTLPSKTEYMTGDTLDTTGLQIAVRYEDGAYDYLTSGFEVERRTFYNTGTQTVNVSYQGCSTSFSVYVKDPSQSITAIGVVSYPYKTAYTEGEYLDPTGLTIRVYTAGNPYDITTGFTLNPQYLGSAGTQTITATYQNFTCTFNVTVRAEEKESLVILTTPERRTYSVGDTLDTTGLVLRYSKGGYAQNITSGFVCNPTRLTQLGSQQIEVTYGGMSCTFRVTVNGGEPGRTENTPATPAINEGEMLLGNGGVPVTPVPTQTPIIISTVKPSPEPAGTKASNGPKTLVVIILITAIAALCGLCAYAYMVDRRKRGISPAPKTGARKNTHRK